MSSAVRVSIRVRPFNRRELAAEAQLAVAVEGNTVTAIHNQEAKTFGYDECFWSHSKPRFIFFRKIWVFSKFWKKNSKNFFKVFSKIFSSFQKLQNFFQKKIQNFSKKFKIFEKKIAKVKKMKPTKGGRALRRSRQGVRLCWGWVDFSLVGRVQLCLMAYGQTGAGKELHDDGNEEGARPDPTNRPGHLPTNGNSRSRTRNHQRGRGQLHGDLLRESQRSARKKRPTAEG